HFASIVWPPAGPSAARGLTGASSTHGSAACTAPTLGTGRRSSASRDMRSTRGPGERVSVTRKPARRLAPFHAHRDGSDVPTMPVLLHQERRLAATALVDTVRAIERVSRCGARLVHPGLIYLPRQCVREEQLTRMHDVAHR